MKSSMESVCLQSDIIYEILSRVSVDTLGRCRVVSKEWNQMTYDSKLKIIRSQMKNIVDGFISPYMIGYKYACSCVSIKDEIFEVSLDFVSGYVASVEAVSAKHGILLFTSNHAFSREIPRLIICKPQIKLFEQIPRPEARITKEIMAISVLRANPLRYKILRITFSGGTYLKNYKEYACEVFDSETWVWKRLIDIELPFKVIFKSLLPPITVCGAIHWLMRPNLIFRFDVENEEWEALKLPVVEDDYYDMKIADYEGKLALICMDSEGFIHTWVLENYRNKVWKKKFAVKIKDLDSDHRLEAPMAFYGSDILVVRTCSSFLYYDFKMGKILKEIKPKTPDLFQNPIFPFWSDSEPCCLRGTSTSELGFRPLETEEDEEGRQRKQE